MSPPKFAAKAPPRLSNCESRRSLRVPVRAQSRRPDDPILASFNRRLTYREAELAREAVRAYSVKSREAERVRQDRPLRCGDLWRSAELVFAYLAEFARNTPEVYPEVETIAAACGLGASTVHEVKGQLRALGLIDWRHRAEPAAEVGPGLPPVRQVSNLYRVNELPPRFLACLQGPRRMAYGLELARGRKEAARRVKEARARAAETAARLKAADRERAGGIAADLARRRQQNEADRAARAAGSPLAPRDSS